MNDEFKKEIERDIPKEYHAGIFEVLKSVPVEVQRDAYLRMKTEILQKIQNR